MQLLGEGDITGAAKKAYSYISPSQIRAEGMSDAVAQVKARFPGLTDTQILSAPKDSIVGKMITDLSPGVIGQYGPMVALNSQNLLRHHKA